tara:strand:+ start:161 stop:373 length:213 start_codon:yes stop_codon:yes gene_type:complete
MFDIANFWWLAVLFRVLDTFGRSSLLYLRGLAFLTARVFWLIFRLWLPLWCENDLGEFVPMLGCIWSYNL